MPRDGAATRTRLLEAAHALMLEGGFAGTSIDDVLAEAGSTKGGFFHHFESKADLRRALIERWSRDEGERLDRALRRAEGLADDPAERLLLFVGLLIDEADDLARGDAGSLPACLLYERRALDGDSQTIIADAMLLWRRRVATLIARAALRRRPRTWIDPVALADELLSLREGAVVLARALGDPSIVARQLRQYRAHLRLLFEEDPPR